MIEKLVVGTLLLAGCTAHEKRANGTPKGADLGAPNGDLGMSNAPLQIAGPAGRLASDSASWIGAAPESDMLLVGRDDAALGVWVDPPSARPRIQPNVDVALVVDTSGSMNGDKIESARTAARALISKLSDGDIVSLDTFSDTAHALVPPTTLSATTREKLLGAIADLHAEGSTNMYDGIALGEAHVAQGPATHAVRRVVVISDGKANVGPSSPDALGALAERGLKAHVQVTSLGVGIDYDEHTLNALAVRSSGRLYHLGEPREMASILSRELELLKATVATDAFVEVVPAAGVQLLGTDGARADWVGDGSLRIPLGALYSGQHREALVRLHVRQVVHVQGKDGMPLASVRLRFHDPAEGGLERVQEVVAHVEWTHDEREAVSHANPKTKSIMAIQEAGQLQMNAAQQVNQGQFQGADKALEIAQKKLSDQAQSTSDATERRRLTEAASNLGHARATTQAAAAAPKAVQRNEALELNKAGMGAMGY